MAGKKKGKQWAGIRPKGGGWEANRRVHPGPGGLKTKMFYGAEPPLAAMQAWRSEQVTTAQQDLPITMGSFAADLQADLPQIQGQACYKGVAGYYARWAEALGRDRGTHTITTAEINAVLQRWLVTPSFSTPHGGRPAPHGLAPGTVRRRRAALYSFFERRGGTNPVRRAYAPPKPKPEARGMDYLKIEALLSVMPPSKSRARCRVMAYTGLPPTMIMAIDPRRDLDLDATPPTLRVTPRRKGQGVEARSFELEDAGVVAAFREFLATEAWGRFRVSGLREAFNRACRRVGIKGARLYDLRHSFGSLMYSKTGDLATVARFMLHSDTKMTERYAQVAMRDVDRQAAVAVGAAFAAARRAVAGQKLDAKVGSASKYRGINQLQQAR